MAATRAPLCFARTTAMEDSVACHQASGSCSAQPGCGVAIASGDVADATRSRLAATRIALTPLVPTSSPRKSGSVTSAHSEQEFHRQLVESLVAVALRAQCLEVELLVANGLRELRGVVDPGARLPATRRELADDRLDLRIRVELRCLL